MGTQMGKRCRKSSKEEKSCNVAKESKGKEMVELVEENDTNEGKVKQDTFSLQTKGTHRIKDAQESFNNKTDSITIYENNCVTEETDTASRKANHYHNSTKIGLIHTHEGNKNIYFQSIEDMNLKCNVNEDKSNANMSSTDILLEDSKTLETYNGDKESYRSQIRGREISTRTNKGTDVDHDGQTDVYEQINMKESAGQSEVHVVHGSSFTLAKENLNGVQNSKLNENEEARTSKFDCITAKERKQLSLHFQEPAKDTNKPVLPLHTLDKILEKMNADNADWIGSITELTKCARTSGKDYQKEITAVLVKNRIAEKFLTFLERNSINLVAKLSPEDSSLLKCWSSYKRFITLLWVLCDGTVTFCQYILTTKVFEYLIMELRVLSTFSHILNDKTLYLLKAALGIFHNICRHVPSSKWAFRNEGLVAVLRIFLNSDKPMVRVKTLIILSYITSETENEIINSDDENFEFIIQVLTDAIGSENHMSLKYGMSAAEILKGLCNLAVNDENKIRIVKNGALPLYEQFLEAGSKEEKKLTVVTLWSLAFHHYNKIKMRDSKGIMEKLHVLEFPEVYSDDDEICHAARGTIWELENVSSASVDRNYSSSSEKDPNVPHIMISYQWDSQPIMVKVKDRLRLAGYKVWMDVEHMTGSTLEAMALAVEKAAVVLICMSQKYKDSPNCRTEAEYVYRLRKDFVPLRLQQDYVPDGWLGILVGTRLYFDVHTEEVIDLQLPRLVRELRDRGKICPVYDTADLGMVPPTRMLSREAAPLLTCRSMEVVSWTHSEVKAWLTSSGCDDLLSRLPELDGQLLTELQHIQTRAPEFFYSILKSEFNLPIFEVLKFSRCLRNLTK